MKDSGPISKIIIWSFWITSANETERKRGLLWRYHQERSAIELYATWECRTILSFTHFRWAGSHYSWSMRLPQQVSGLIAILSMQRFRRSVGHPLQSDSPHRLLDQPCRTVSASLAVSRGIILCMFSFSQLLQKTLLPFPVFFFDAFGTIGSIATLPFAVFVIIFVLLFFIHKNQ